MQRQSPTDTSEFLVLIMQISRMDYSPKDVHLILTRCCLQLSLLPYSSPTPTDTWSGTSPPPSQLKHHKAAGETKRASAIKPPA